jgi:tripartite ATP-independent transporter DctP family solute receptor
MHTKRLLGCIVLALFFSGAMAFGSGSEEKNSSVKEDPVVVLKAATNNSKISGHYKGLEIFKNLVETRTKGRVMVELYSDAVLGDEEQMAEGMKMGTVDVMMAAAAKYANFVPEMDIYSPPYIFKNWNHFKAVAKSPVEERLRKAVMERTGDYYMGLFTDGVRNVFTRKQVNTLADLKGLKLRTMTGPNETNSWKALGTNPTPLAYTELYAALQAGVVDGAENTMTSILGMKFFESSKFVLKTGHNFLALPFLISRKAIDKVPKDLREVVLQAGRDAVTAQVDMAIRFDTENEEALKKLGVTIVQMSNADIVEAIGLCNPVHEENAKRIKMEAELAIIRELAKKF